MTEQLYNAAILRLAASIPHDARLVGAHGSATRVSPVCGSRVVADAIVGSDGRIERFGQEVRACALGQASAAVLGAGVIGRSPDEIAAARDALAAYLRGAADAPAGWPGLELFGPARAHRARHGSILLAFDAAAGAASAAAAARVPA